MFGLFYWSKLCDLCANLSDFSAVKKQPVTAEGTEETTRKGRRETALLSGFPLPLVS